MREPTLPSKNALSRLMFLSRGLQAPLCLVLTFVASAIALAWIDRRTFKPVEKAHQRFP